MRASASEGCGADLRRVAAGLSPGAACASASPGPGAVCGVFSGVENALLQFPQALGGFRKRHGNRLERGAEVENPQVRRNRKCL